MRGGLTALSPSLAGLAAAVGVSACIPVQVTAPDKPIEINLNVNIRQEVVVRLEGDAQDLLHNNPNLF
ncbi:MAG TPA: YnbE family lipoprotein [Caulobacterales bacterium]|nr:YnbE family lipoprotein [Caulobacterales bacterium]